MRQLLRRYKTNPVRTLLTALQVTLASFAVTLTLSVYLTPEDPLAANTFHLVAGFQDGQGSATMYNLFKPADVKTLGEFAPDVLALGVLEYTFYPEFSFNGQRYQFQNGATVSPEYLELRNPDMTRGSTFSTSEAETEEAVLLISDAAARTIFGDADPIGQTLLEASTTGAATPYRVIGTFADATGEAAASAPAVYFPVWAASSTHFIVGPFATSQLIVRSASGRSEAAGQQLLAAVRRQYREHPQLAGVQPGRDFYVSQQNDLIVMTSDLNPNRVILGLFGVMALTIGSIGVFSSTVVCVAERGYEIGIKRALGATGGAVGREFAVEALLLTLVGAPFGAGLAAVLLPPLVGLLGSFFFGGAVVWQPLAALVAVGLTALLGSVLSLVPALQTVRAAPVEGLRNV